MWSSPLTWSSYVVLLSVPAVPAVVQADIRPRTSTSTQMIEKPLVIKAQDPVEALEVAHLDQSPLNLVLL